MRGTEHATVRTLMKKPNMASADWDRLRAYALALLFVTVALAAKFFAGVTADAATFVLLSAAVAASAATGGLSTGLVATLTAVVLARIVNHAPLSASLLFAMEGFVITLVIVRLSATTEEYVREVDAAEARIRDLKVLERRGRVLDIACERLEQVPSDYAMVILDPKGRITDWRAGAQRQYGWQAPDVVGTDGAKLFVPASGDEEFGQLLARAHASGIARCTGRQRRVDGTEFDADLEVQPLAERGCEGFTMLVHDRTREQEWQAFTASSADAQVALREEAAVAQRQLATLQHVTDPTLYALPTGDIITALLDRLREAVDADGVALVRGNGPRLRVAAATDGLQPTGGTERYAGETDRISDHRTLLIQNDPARVAEMSLAGWPETVSSLIAVPVVYAGRVEGTIEVVGLRGRRSTEWELAVIQVVAGRFAGHTLGERYLRADAVA
jgi:PAS domain S-box-containing protein